MLQQLVLVTLKSKMSSQDFVLRLFVVQLSTLRYHVFSMQTFYLVQLGLAACYAASSSSPCCLLCSDV